jgi:hypothetical protein
MLLAHGALVVMQGGYVCRMSDLELYSEAGEEMGVLELEQREIQEVAQGQGRLR